jgi:hypothetical protein
MKAISQILAALAVAGCDPGNSSNLKPVTDWATATLAAGGVLDAVKGDVYPKLQPSASAISLSIPGDLGGTANVSGYFEAPACGSGVGHYWEMNIDVAFNDFRAMGTSTNTEKRLTGSVHWSASWGNCSSFSLDSSELKSQSGPVKVTLSIDGGSWGYEDTITFDATGDPVSGGWVQPAGRARIDL